MLISPIHFPLSRFTYKAFTLSFVFLALTISSASAQNNEDDEIISVETNIVVLNLTATDENGKFVRGLKPQDLIISEDNQPQKIVTFSVEETPFAAAVLIDFSGSMENRMSLARAAAIRFLDGLRSDDVAAVYRFDSEIKQLQDFSSSRDLAPVAYSRKADGMTMLNDSIVEAANALTKRPEKRRAIVILSDGADTRSKASSDAALNAALSAGATIYAVDMGEDKMINRASAAGVLRNYANKSGGRFVATPGGLELRKAFAEIVEELTNQYTITYRPLNTQHDGRWRNITVAASKPEITIRTRRGYRARGGKRK